MPCRIEDGGWVVDVRYGGRPFRHRFYVGLGDPEAAVEIVRRSLKPDRGKTVHAFRRLSSTHVKLLKLKPGELRAT